MILLGVAVIVLTIWLCWDSSSSVHTDLKHSDLEERNK